MTTTSKVTVAATGWTEVSTDSTDVSIHFGSSTGVVEIHVGQSAPGASDVGVPMSNDLRTLTFSGLNAADDIYARQKVAPKGNISLIELIVVKA